MLQVPHSSQRSDAVLQAFGGPQSSHRPAARDDTYYLQDGSFILRVEDTLFNVRLLHHIQRLMRVNLSHRSTVPC